MIRGKRIVVIMPAYNAERTLEDTYQALDHDLVDEVILVDDASTDHTEALARRLCIRTFAHPENRGYGANQKTCYAKALETGADVVVMVHPDYQYEPRLATVMATMVAAGVYDCVIGSRILGGGALTGGMPRYKYVANRFLTLVQNLLIRQKLSEYHTGFRAFSREVLETLPLMENDDDFVFDNQMLAQVLHFGFRLGEISVPAKYFAEASSINFRRSVKYGAGVLATSALVALTRLGLARPRFLDPAGRKLGH